MYNAFHWIIVHTYAVEAIFKDFFIVSYHLILELQFFDNRLIFNSVRHALTRGITEFFVRAAIGYRRATFWI
jgi:hypothetical protein